MAYRLAALALSLAFFGCGVDEYRFVPDDGSDDGGPATPTTPTVCGSDADCADFSATAVCDTRSGYCAECVAAREAELDRCGEGLYCQPDGRCAIGCESDSECGGLICDLARHVCTGCTVDAECAPGTRCDDSTCVFGCAASDTCPAGFSCCTGLCRNYLTDPGSCGSCGASCEADGQCLNGVCGPAPCEEGLGECDGDAENGCETELASDPTNCGRCRAVCASGLCSGGVCTSSECPEGSADCNQDESDRCEASLSSLENCISCGKVCNDRNGEPSCTSRGCTIVCNDGFGDCDEDADTGCESDLADDVANCGACGAACENEHGRTRCIDGQCIPTCSQGFADCNEDPNDGCETDLESSANHCGACGERCRSDNATGVCTDGVCGADCNSGFEDCNGDIGDGCEADLTSPETCGDCTTHCSDNGGTASCSAGECEIDCNLGRGDCINGVLDGCETNTNVSVLHCRECGTMCPTAVGTPACFDGVCGVSTCSDPRAECDGDDVTVCESDLTDDPNNCGACGTECYFPNANGACVNRTCRLDGCEPGWDDCDDDPDNGCETALGTVRDCAACGNACTNTHGTTACAGSPDSFACSPSCSVGWLSCTNPDDGCETDATMTTVRATAGNGRVVLSWGAVAAATSYTVRRGTTSGGPYTNVATGVTATSYVNTNLTNGTAYYYVVAAVVPCGAGPNSVEVVSRPDGFLVAHYLFDETTGTSAADASGNGRTAALSSATWTAGRRGNAVRIAGGTQRVNLPANIVQGCTDLTIATWVRLTTNTDWGRIFDFGGGMNNYMFLTPRPAGNQLRFAITVAGNAGEQQLTYGYTFPTATWKHVAVVLAGNTGRLYLDAVEVAQNTGLTLNPVDLGGTANDWLGDSQFAVDPTLDGAIDDFRISCRAYSAAEITALTL
jgi:hypothetical protein